MQPEEPSEGSSTLLFSLIGLVFFSLFSLLAQKSLSRMSKQTVPKWEINIWFCDV